MTLYRRPAGAFSGFEVIKDGKYVGGYFSPIVRVKPFTPYTYVAQGTGSGTYPYETPGTGHPDTSSVTIKYDPGWHDPLTLAVCDPLYPAKVLSADRYEDSSDAGEDLLMSSKTFTLSQGTNSMMVYYSGCTPYGNNADGWWFGKNGGRNNGMPVDGIAQVFEKPTSPYKLKQVVINVIGLKVTAPVEVTCKVYRLNDGIPAYDDDGGCVTMDETLDDLIATGRATLTPDSEDLIIFDLYAEQDGLEHIDQPIIDDAIIVVFDGYNDPEMENLADFSACVSRHTHADEGYGELAYLKYGLTDDDGNFSGEYVWVGLNNFFSTGEMKTGFTIFLTIDYPYIAFVYDDGNPIYTFDENGGPMEKEYEMPDDGSIITTQCIDFYTSDEDVEITCNGNEPPDWLDIELAFCDGENDWYGHPTLVSAAVTAAPLPEGVNYRSATVRFAIPGDHVDYTFHQVRGNNPSDSGDLNNDGEVNIADINALIGFIFNDISLGDLNKDGETNIADLNLLISIILDNSN